MRQQSPPPLPPPPFVFDFVSKDRYARQLAGNPRTNLYRRPLSPQRGATANLNDPENKLTNGITKGHVPGANAYATFTCGTPLPTAPGTQ